MRLRLIRRRYAKREEEEKSRRQNHQQQQQQQRCEQLPSTLLQNRRGVASAAKRFYRVRVCNV